MRSIQRERTRLATLIVDASERLFHQFDFTRPTMMAALRRACDRGQVANIVGDYPRMINAIRDLESYFPRKAKR